MVILRFFNSQHFFHNFARTRFVRTKVVVTPNLSYLWQHLMAYSESWVKAISKNGMSFSSTFWNHPKIQNRKTLSKFSGQLFQPFLDQILCFLLVLASTFTTFNHVKWNYKSILCNTLNKRCFQSAQLSIFQLWLNWRVFVEPQPKCTAFSSIGYLPLAVKLFCSLVILDTC